MDIVALFYDLDKFVVTFQPQFNRPLLEYGKRHRHIEGAGDLRPYPELTLIT